MKGRMGVIIYTLLCILKCTDRYIDNSDMELFLKKEGYTLFHPIVSPDGQSVYYLAYPMDSRDYNGEGYYLWLKMVGELWKIEIESRKNRKLTESYFAGMAISPDGTKLALITSTPVEDEEDTLYYSSGYPWGRIVISDTAGIIIDTLPTSSFTIYDVEFSKDGEYLYFVTKGPLYGDTVPHGFYRIRTDGSGEELIKELGIWEGENFFTLDDKDSIYEAHKVWSPQFHPEKKELVIDDCVINNYSFGFVIRNISTKESYILWADPYVGASIAYPYWFPNGDDIIYTEACSGGGEFSDGWYDGELWIYRNVFEHLIKE